MRRTCLDVIETYIKILKYLLENDIGIDSLDDKSIYLDKDTFHKLLREFSYVDIRKQLKLWREMNFILTDKKEQRFTKKVSIDGKYYRMVVVNMEPYFVLHDEQLIEKVIKEFIIIIDLINKKKPQMIIENDNTFYINKDFFERILSQKLFLESHRKLECLRALNLILVDKDRKRFTKKVVINGIGIRKVVANKKLLEMIK